MMKTYLFTIVLTVFSFQAFANICTDTLPHPLGLENFQGFITFSEENSDGKTYRKVTDQEEIFVPGLTREIYQGIKESPSDIAKLFGAELISEINSNNFRLGIPVLGLDLTFDVEVQETSKDSLSIELKNFNTFFHKGTAQLEIKSFDNNGATLALNGEALIPKTASTIFIYGVGGENNFKKLLQTEVDNQIAAALLRFSKFNSADK
tara:strand:+ start:557 stop:1177 length:621 start_codon:yes stop_codon:yes gene_type:complete